MEPIEKKVAKDSANWAINSGDPSNESNIKVNNQIVELFGCQISDEVSFYIYKEDFIKSLCCIFGHLPLAKSHTGKLENFSLKSFEQDMKTIENFFGTENRKKITATLKKPKGHSPCLNFGDNNFPIREYLLEQHSKLTYSKDNTTNEISVRVSFDHTPEKNNETSFGDVKMNLQQIIYGAPGTGKSYSINKKIGKHSEFVFDKLEKKYIIPECVLFRTTFHPDYDYAQFVGCYKPQKTEAGFTYDFKPQVFTEAYKAAYNNPNTHIYLVIEEINRGYCAQIFGDIFQLLDRDKNGRSEYGIKPDADLTEHLKKYCPIGLIDGEIRLPRNLSIIATMNTSDQSLFPMDSAFKRRWDWVFTPIDYNDAEQFYIEVGSYVYNWGKVIKSLNEKINTLLESADKQIGNRFIRFTDDNKSKEHPVEENVFINKVLFYLWTDVYKDFEDKGIFKGYSFEGIFDKKKERKKILDDIMNEIVEGYKEKEDGLTNVRFEKIEPQDDSEGLLGSPDNTPEEASQEGEALEERTEINY